VGVNHLREAFKVAMQGMYGGAGIARLLEASPNHRASDDRAMLDDVLLWTAHEIGADYEEKPVFNEQPVDKARRLGDRADVVVVATSQLPIRWRKRLETKITLHVESGTMPTRLPRIGSSAIIDLALLSNQV